ncbi:MAG: efflux RND transporter periplasmic adaptor subunit, partial [Planctomycetota bacterium]|nr:efflux RND transporter periplasmic adaptor subunit [Planctomycetota bacterium]
MKIVLIVVLLLVAALITGAFLAGPQLRDTLAGLAPEPQGTEVWVEPVKAGTLVETVQAPGAIEPHTDIEIRPEVSAQILELPYREGDQVRKGDVVCQLNDKELKAALVSARALRDGERFRLQSDQARLEGLQNNIAFARRDLERVRKLYETGDESQRNLDTAQERVDDLQTSIEATAYSISVAESNLAAAEAEIERAEDSFEKTTIVASMDGVITFLDVEVGEVVTGSLTNPGTVMMVIADLSRMILKAEVAESDVAKVQVGQSAKIHINAYPEEVFSGTVRQIALQRSVSPNGTGYFETEVEIDLQGRRIYSGLIANVDIEIATHEGLVVPYQAIVVREVEELPDEARNNPLVDRTKRKASVVYRVNENKAVCTPVRPGPSDLTHRLILDGLEEGDEIVIGPYKVLETIEHDERVKIGENGAAGGEDDQPPEDQAPLEGEDEADRTP